MDVKPYLAPLVKWWKLIRAAALIAGGFTLLLVIFQGQVYESRTTLLIGQSINSPNPSTSQFNLEQELAKIYADMALREPVRRAAMEATGLSRLPEYSVTALPSTQLVEIVVRDTDRIRAQTVATELARQLILRAPTNAGGSAPGRQEFVDQQLTRLQSDMTSTQSEIDALRVVLGGLRGAREIADTERQIAALDDKLRSLQSNFASLQAGSPRGAINTLTVIEPAEIGTRAKGTNRFFSVLLAMILGAGLATAAAYALDMLDRRVIHTGEALRILGWPLLAELEELPTGTDVSSYLAEHPQSTLANAYRSVKTNLELQGVGDGVKTILVTGPSVMEGKTTVARNLAATFAHAGRKVILIDADTQRASANSHSSKGLSNLLMEGGDPKACLVPSGIEKLALLPAGENPRAATDRMEPAALRRILEGLRGIADLIVLDGPPAFISDTLSLAVSVQGIVAVVRLGTSPWEAMTNMRRQFEGAHANILGLVVNGISARPAYYYGYYAQSAPPSRFDALRGYWQRAQAGWEQLRSRLPHRRLKNDRREPTAPTL